MDDGRRLAVVRDGVHVLADVLSLSSTPHDHIGSGVLSIGLTSAVACCAKLCCSIGAHLVLAELV